MHTSLVHHPQHPRPLYHRLISHLCLPPHLKHKKQKSKQSFCFKTIISRTIILFEMPCSLFFNIRCSRFFHRDLHSFTHLNPLIPDQGSEKNQIPSQPTQCQGQENIQITNCVDNKTIALSFSCFGWVQGLGC